MLLRVAQCGGGEAEELTISDRPLCNCTLWKITREIKQRLRTFSRVARCFGCEHLMNVKVKAKMIQQVMAKMNVLPTVAGIAYQNPLCSTK
ncbi:hypothetical protein Nepgr_018314 [Nepenthes gracilis]|uniref:Uncharacterized protein n=1 Tax=Nepenthes gracilis TaxID=150966 RepID=A0AAD3SR48_NEPGR|nr:hypothetical protein Nepgr_018314 [Nepenthes gracilis]